MLCGRYDVPHAKSSPLFSRGKNSITSTSINTYGDARGKFTHSFPRRATFVTLLSALFITASAFAPGYARQTDKRPTIAPTGADCRKLAEAAADKVKKNGGTEKQQQAAYERAKYNCMGKM